MFKALFWKLLERFGVQAIQFILQIILARLLAPEHYGVLSLMIIFTSLANVFIQQGFNSSLVQNKNVTEDDYSSVFWVTFGMSFAIYIILFFAAPGISYFYKMPELTQPFRVICLMLFPGALNSIQLAKVSREMNFKQVFQSNVVAIAVAGIVGIALAYAGAEIWALVIQNLLNTTIACIVMWFTVKWHPRFVCNLRRIKELFSYGWKILVSGLIDTLYQDLRSLVIGKKYAADTLGYYNRGKQFPQFIINAINSTLQSVMLPAMSAKQDDKNQVKSIMRHSIILSSYIIFPMMAGLAGIAAPLVQVLLTDKWSPCVPFLQIYCFTLAFYPVHTCNLQAINAMGHSNIFLKLEIIKKGIGVFALLIAVFCFDSPLAIAMTGAITTITSCFINAYPNKKLIGYSYLEQMKDIFPAFLASAIMLFGILIISLIQLNNVLILILQLISGVLLYVLISIIFRIKAFLILKSIVKSFIQNRFSI